MVGDQPKAKMYQVARAFRTWQLHTQFKFIRLNYPNKADLTVASYRRNQGDGPPFNGQWNIVAWGSFPPDGKFRFDSDERWSEKWSPTPIPGALDLESVSLHEIGHLLGLAHTPIKEAVMYPYTAVGVTKRFLNKDDIDGIRDLYPLSKS